MSTIKRLAPSITISDNPSEVFCCQFSPDGRLLAAGCGDGAIRVFNAFTGRLSYQLNQGATTGLPTTSLRFRPVTTASKTKNVLLAANAAGIVQHWHITSGKCLHTIENEDNQLYAVDYRPDGALFATAGRDYTVRVYDEATKTEVISLMGGYRSAGLQSPGHSNRVFSLKFHPDQPDILLSGGWDNTVQIWDLRVEQSVRSLFGPHICGDALDLSGDQVLTGSWRPEDPLELWDFGSGEKICSVPWHQSNLRGQPCMLYAAQFSKGEGSMFAAGGSGANEAKVFDRSRDNRLIGTVAGLSRGVFTLDFSPDGTKIAVAGGDASVRIIDIFDTVADDDADAEPVHIQDEEPVEPPSEAKYGERKLFADSDDEDSKYWSAKAAGGEVGDAGAGGDELSESKLRESKA